MTIFSTTTTSASASSAVGIALLGVAAFLALWRQRKVIQDTTLGSTWWWSVTVLASVSGCELLVCLFAPSGTAVWIPPLRFLAAASSFCPGVSLLGAKRPQDGMWNFIVFSLWGVLALPAAESLFLQSGQALEVDDLRAWFLWGLIGASALNFLPTRRWLFALLFAAGQIVLLADYLPLLKWPTDARTQGLGAAFIVAAWWSNSRALPDRTQLPALDRAWLDFRDLFGALWGLRIVERINSTATTNRWDVFLSWDGFGRMSNLANAAPTNALPLETDQALRQSLVNLLRRFVDAAWLRARLGEATEVSAEDGC